MRKGKGWGGPRRQWGGGGGGVCGQVLFCCEIMQSRGDWP